jgi:tetratricopeptide (TPR) repeat protein
MLVSLWTLSFAFAEPLSDLSISLDTEIEDQLLRNLQGLDDADKITVVQNFEQTVFASARIHYELGLQYNQQGNITMAERQYRASLSIDDAYIPALYDLAEILLLRGDTKEAKLHLLTLQQQQGQHWVVSYRLAQIAASEKDTAVMELNLKRALREGMPSQVLLDDKAQWQIHLANRTVALSMELLLAALGHESIWNGIKPVPQ